MIRHFRTIEQAAFYPARGAAAVAGKIISVITLFRRRRFSVAAARRRKAFTAETRAALRAAAYRAAMNFHSLTAAKIVGGAEAVDTRRIASQARGTLSFFNFALSGAAVLRNSVAVVAFLIAFKPEIAADRFPFAIRGAAVAAIGIAVIASFRKLRNPVPAADARVTRRARHPVDSRGRIAFRLAVAVAPVAACKIAVIAFFARPDNSVAADLGLFETADPGTSVP